MGEETEHVAALAKLIEAAHLHLHQFSDSRIAISFVHDISTDSFCFFAMLLFFLSLSFPASPADGRRPRTRSSLLQQRPSAAPPDTAADIRAAPT